MRFRFFFSLLALSFLLLINYLPFYVLDISDGQETRRLFRDGSIIEDTQFLQLLVATIFLVAAIARKGLKTAPRLEIFIAIGLCWAAIRELDSFFENSNLVTLYYVLKYGLTALGVLFFSKYFRPIFREWRETARTAPLLLFQAGVMLYILAQVVGSQIAGKDRILKRVYEESIELAGGSFIFLSASLILLLAIPFLARLWNGDDLDELPAPAAEAID